VLALGLIHGRVKLDQNLAGGDGLSIVHMDGANDAGFERLDYLGSPAGDDPTCCGRDNVEFAEARPGERQAK
jgi:hypothetical protein